MAVDQLLVFRLLSLVSWLQTVILTVLMLSVTQLRVGSHRILSAFYLFSR